MAAEKRVQQKNNTETLQQQSRLDITYYTDPLCCWSWAFEPVWKQLRADPRYALHIRYCMGGMLSSWEHYHDAVRSISKPVQMGPVWSEVKQLTGCTLNDRIWFTDPPASSYPACLAVKCAEQQSVLAAERYLENVRAAVMIHGRNIARKEVLLAIARETEAADPQLFNAAAFEQGLEQPQVLESFKKDLEEVKARNISRFPALLIRAENSTRQLLLTGYRPYDVLESSIAKLLSS